MIKNAEKYMIMGLWIMDDSMELKLVDCNKMFDVKITIKGND